MDKKEELFKIYVKKKGFNVVKDNGEFLFKDFYSNIFWNSFFKIIIIKDYKTNLSIVADINGKVILNEWFERIIYKFKNKNIFIVANGKVYFYINAETKTKKFITTTKKFDYKEIRESEDKVIVIDEIEGKENILKSDGTFLLKEWVDEVEDLFDVF